MSGKADQAWLAVRIAQVQAFADRGMSLADIGGELGITRQAVHEFANKYGIVRTPAKPKPRPPRHPELHNCDWLAGAAASQPDAEIARHLGCAAASVQVARLRCRIKRDLHRADRRLDDADWLAERYAAKSITAIGHELGCDAMTVHRAMVRHGISRRRPGPRTEGES